MSSVPACSRRGARWNWPTTLFVRRGPVRFRLGGGAQVVFISVLCGLRSRSSSGPVHQLSGGGTIGLEERGPCRARDALTSRDMGRRRSAPSVHCGSRVPGHTEEPGLRSRLPVMQCLSVIAFPVCASGSWQQSCAASAFTLRLGGQVVLPERLVLVPCVEDSGVGHDVARQNRKVVCPGQNPIDVAHR